jgi:hypothetical protein
MTRSRQHRMTPGLAPTACSAAVWVGIGRQALSQPPDARPHGVSPGPVAAETHTGPRNLKSRGPAPRYEPKMSYVRTAAAQNGLAGTPAHGSGMVGWAGSAKMLILVCFG